jgi:hypothetical protein
MLFWIDVNNPNARHNYSSEDGDDLIFAEDKSAGWEMNRCA